MCASNATILAPEMNPTSTPCYYFNFSSENGLANPIAVSPAGSISGGNPACSNATIPMCGIS